MKNLILFGALFAYSLLFAQTGDNVLHFDGVNDHVNINAISNSMANLTNGFTIEFWTSFNVNNNSNYEVMFGANSATGGNRFLIRTAGPADNALPGTIVLYLEDAGGNSTTISGGTAIGDGNCHHVAVVNNGNGFRIFIDGVADGNGTFNLNFQANDQFSLGQEYDGLNTTQFFNGTLEEFRIWNVARTQAQIVAASQFDVNFIPPGLIHLYSFDQGTPSGNNTGITTLTNGVNFAGNGTLVNFTMTGGISNFLRDLCDNSLDFDGTTDFVNLDNIANTVVATGTNSTIELWTRFLRAENSNYNVLFGINDANGGNRFLIRTAGPNDAAAPGTIVLYLGPIGSSITIEGNTDIGDGACHHIAVVRTGTTFDLYIDGVLDATGTYNLNIAASDQFSLGQEYDNGNTSQFFDGRIDDFRIWRISKTAAQIVSQNGSDLVGNEPNLVTYFGFNQGFPGGNNTFITTLINSANPTENGGLNTFALTGNASNFVNDNCRLLSSFTKDPFSRGKTVHDEFEIDVSYDSSIDVLNIQSPDMDENAMVTIFDLNGSVYYHEVLKREGPEQIDVSQLGRGLFMVNIVSGTNIKRQKFVKF